MKAVLVTPEGKEEEVRALAVECGLEVVTEKPDIVVSYGGDGTFMRSEGIWPGVPKVILRSSAVCKLCSPLENKEVLARVVSNKYSVEELRKLVVAAKGVWLEGVNDIVVHNGDPRHAIRYELFVNGNKAGSQVIGDGIVVATPLGSTGYYRSITDSFFETGIGLAFNNSTEQSDHMVLSDDAVIRVVITRGPAVVYADNKEEMITLAEGEEAEIQRAKGVARIIRV